LETITCFATLTSSDLFCLYWQAGLLLLLPFSFVCCFLNVHNSNYVRLITLLPDAGNNGKFVPVLPTKARK
jgi:hypothetical protein